MADNYTQLLDKVHEIHDLQKAGALLSWDRQVIMPKAGEAIRIQQIATVNRFTHTLFIADEMGELIERAAEEIEGAEYDSDEASLIRYLRREYQNARKLPPEFVERQSKVSGKAHTIWREARENNDFASYEPWLDRIIELGQEKAELYGYEDEPYDALLDKYEAGAETAQVRTVFEQVKEATVPLLQAIQEEGRTIDDSFLHGDYNVEKQKEFARYIADAVGYDFDRGHLGTAVHPFASSFSRFDARITTRWYPDFINPSLFGTLHESGHAIYEQNTHPDLARTPLARGTSSGIHESQSRMIENIVGRSRGFWRAHYSRLQELFSEQLGDVDVEQFYRAVNKVQPSFIRVEADELTYNMHIILRFEVEQALVKGDFTAKHTPSAWNSKMESLLGVVPPTDSQGVLQDIHWTWPSFGYFPTYALGNLYAAQLFDAAVKETPAIEAEMEAGKTDALLGWLRENVHQHGRKFLPTELIERATGSPLRHEPFVEYVKKKFSDVYGL
ncbi:MAG: carboxypeptidase M32 [Candidatus Promineifilaceae bacterium]|nr:carboxypeptidase M32 [Candidatus Promineifilaceae bacterium]